MSSTTTQYISHSVGIDGLTKRGIPTRRHSPRPDGVLVQVNAASLDYRDMEDMAGTILGIETSVTKWKIGDRVLSTFVPAHKTGQLSEQALSSSARAPAACVTAWMAINGGRAIGQPGNGEVSIAGLLNCEGTGCKRYGWFIDLTLSRSKVFGSDFTVKYKERAGWESYMMEVTNGHGADIILETGGSRGLEKAFPCAAYGGLINCIGYTSGKTQAAGEQPNINFLTISRCLTLRGFVNVPTDRFEETVRYIEKNRIRPVNCMVLGLGEVKEAFKYLEAGSHSGKIVIRVEH
ncbi:uncharacterized protein BDV17DRAFT_278448 [Aspergillus undulatus]|uniref:uncharacterized protein n=1 Tax=Aspergillus undulatus TaxID=1810928 RepID=UPI003CCD79D4